MTHRFARKMQTALLLLALFIVALTIYSLYRGTLKLDKRAAIPARPMCWMIEDRIVPSASPAYWYERELLHDMSHESSTSLRCRGEINGRLIEFEADQVWILRELPTGEVHPE